MTKSTSESPDVAKQSGETSPTTDADIKTSPLGSLPAELISQLTVMRRDPADFRLRGRSSCSLGCDRKGERSAYQLAHVDVVEAGTWCPVHGWLSFQSDALPPTERLTVSEIEDNRIAEQRRRKAVAE